MAPPAGTVTFLFTDIEGSTRLWEEHPTEMAAALAWHDSLMRGLIEAHAGYVFKTVGDAFCAAFPTAGEGVAAALAIQQALRAAEPRAPGQARAEGLPVLRIRVRMGLHTGTAQQRDNDYFGPTLNRTARLQSLAVGGQVVMTRATAEAARPSLPAPTELRELGTHRLKDLNAPEVVFQLVHPDLQDEFPPLRSIGAYPQNLPQQTTSFVGREDEVRAIQGHLKQSRLVTLVGPGGTGKTRLSLQVGAESLEQYPDGVWFLELAALNEPALVVHELASVLKVREEDVGAGGIVALLIAHLVSRRTLLIVDNCEHLIRACAELVGRLLQQCPGVRILASSREPLFVPGETLHRVPSLTPPDPDQLPADPLERVRVLAENAAVRLFLERAAAVRPDFVLTPENSAAVVRICRQLDGIPLALELAASRVRSMPAEQLAARLDDCLRILTGGSRTLDPRQQTLRALIDWSYDLLSSEERLLFARLSVFAGGWTLEAAEEVCGDPDDAPGPELLDRYAVLDLLTALQDRSLVVYAERDGAGRYSFLQTIRQYARERLRSRGEAELLEERRLSYCLGRARLAEREWHGARQGEWLAELEREQDNERAALEYALAADARSGPVRAAGVSLASALWTFWEVRSEWSEGRAWLERALCHAAAGSPARAHLLAGATQMALRQGDYAAARVAAEEGLSIHEQLQEPAGTAVALNNLANVAARQGDLELARTCHERSLALEESLGNAHGIAVSLNNLGLTAYEQGNYAAARAFYERALARYRELGDLHETAIALYNLGEAASRQGDRDAAWGFLRECLGFARRAGARFVMAFALEEAGRVAMAGGDGLAAARLWGAAEAIRKAIEWQLSPTEHTRHEVEIADARTAAGGAECFAVGWAAGRGASLDEMARLLDDNAES